MPPMTLSFSCPTFGAKYFIYWHSMKWIIFWFQRFLILTSRELSGESHCLLFLILFQFDPWEATCCESECLHDEKVLSFLLPTCVAINTHTQLVKVSDKYARAFYRRPVSDKYARALYRRPVVICESFARFQANVKMKRLQFDSRVKLKMSRATQANKSQLMKRCA